MAFLTGQPPGIYGETIGYLSLGRRFKTGLNRREKKSAESINHEYLDQALVDFSGYITVDEVYDGPFCIISIVDNRTFRRLMNEVKDRTASADDARSLFQRFKEKLDSKGLIVFGITTDGSKIYPEPILEVFGPIPHQICEFHVLKEIVKAVIKVVSKSRNEIKTHLPSLPPGRPSSCESRKAARKKKRLQAKITELFDHRHLFVKRSLTPAEKLTLQRITKGLPHLRYLRSIMDEVYRLFDRRCRTETALAKLAKLRNRVKRFKYLCRTLNKLFSPNLEKALTFLDESLLPPTSNAVERGNRRFRKMQKTIYCVRTKEHLEQRIALDMQREANAVGRQQTIFSLHQSRRKTG